MAMKVFVDNTTLPASDINEYLVNTKYVTKPGGTTRTGTSPSADPDLSLAYDSNKSYLLDMVVLYQGASGGLKWNFATGGGNNLYAIYQLQTSQIGTTANAAGGTYDGGVNTNLGTTLNFSALSGFALTDALIVRGTFVTSGTSGTITLQWSQNSASGNLTAVTGSWMLLRRIS